MTSDYDPAQGGANPFVGLASGGAFGKFDVALAPGLTLGTTVTERSLRRDTQSYTLAQLQAVGNFEPYHATAANLTLGYDLDDDVHTSFGYTMLHEANALLGTESVDRGDLPNGSTTDAATFGADVRLMRTLGFGGSVTVGRTRAGNSDRTGLAVGKAGLVSTAFEVAATKTHLLDRGDSLRLSMAQPMHVEGGSIDYTLVKVVDRDTGQLGTVTQSLPLQDQGRRYVAEAIYGRSFLGGKGQVNVFGRANLGTVNRADIVPLTIGSSVRLNF